MGQLSIMRKELAYIRTYAAVITVLAVVLGASAVALAFEVLHLRDVVGGVL